MPTVTVLQGLPGSGKSELAKGIAGIRFNLDDIRAALGFPSGSDLWSKDNEQVAVAAMMAGAKKALHQGCSITMDNCHLTRSLPNLYRKEFQPLNVDWRVLSLIDTPIEDCIKRDIDREATVGEKVIRRIWDGRSTNGNAKATWRLTEEWLREPATGKHKGTVPPATPYVGRINLPKAYIFDIDGTVALHGDERGHYEYEKVGGDKPNLPVIETALRLGGDAEILFVSGREDSCREETERWLLRYGLTFGAEKPTLFMRKTGDHRPDYIIKREIFDAHIRDAFNVLGAYDDRTQVVRNCWRAMGLTTYQCADGDF